MSMQRVGKGFEQRASLLRDGSTKSAPLKRQLRLVCQHGGLQEREMDDQIARREHTPCPTTRRQLVRTR